MDLDCLEVEGQRYAVGPEQAPLMRTAEDVIGLIEARGACGAQGVLLFAENLPPGFVDLSTGVAGHVLLKLQMYRVPLAVVLPLATTPHSEHFAAMVREANRGRDFHVAATRAEAEAWLLQRREAGR
jgi:hypothetical protein